MKRKVGIIAGCLLLAALVRAMVVVYQTPLLNETALAYSKNATLDLNNAGVDYLSAQAVYSTATISAVTVTDGTKGSGTITISSFSAAGRVVINGCIFDPTTNYAITTSNNATAKALSDAIMASSCLSGVVVSTYVSNVVYATSTVAGTSANYAMFSSSAAAVVLSGDNFTGGTDSAFNLTTDVVTSSAHHLTLALPVLYTKTAGTSPSPLSAGTTYFAIPSGVNTFQLATTSTGAIATSAIDITTMTAGGGGTFVFTPLAFTGSASFKWQQSNDGTNFSDINVSSVTITSATTANSTTLWDFSAVDYRYVRVAFVGPTRGGVAIVITPNGKNTYKYSGQ